MLGAKALVRNPHFSGRVLLRVEGMTEDEAYLPSEITKMKTSESKYNFDSMKVQLFQSFQSSPCLDTTTASHYSNSPLRSILSLLPFFMHGRVTMVCAFDVGIP